MTTTRRLLLKALGLAPLVGTLPACARRGADLRAVVVGGGAAGLAAAQALLAEGTDVTVLEASERIGGRVKALTGFSDFPIELGAEEVHGSNTAFHDLLVEDGAVFVEGEEEDRFVVDGVLYGEELLEQADFAAAEEFADSIGDWTGGDVTIAQRIEDEGIPARSVFLLEAWIGNEYGAENASLGARAIAQAEEAWTAGNTNQLLDGTSIIEHLERGFADAWARVETDRAVVEIDYSGEDIVVRCADGSRYLCDAVIVAVPVTILRDGDITFTPALSADKQAAIAGVPMGAGMKVVLRFDRRFWPGDLGSLYGGTAVPEYWATGLGRSVEQNVLTAFVLGEKAAALSALGEEGAIAAVLADLDAMFGDSTASDAYADGVVQDWTTEPWVRGGYSYPAPESQEAREELARAVDGRVHFAGEATHTEGHFATVHGAIETGARAAEALLAWWDED